MRTLIEAFLGAVHLLQNLDPKMVAIVGLTLRITGTGLVFAMVLGLPIGALLGLSRRIPAAGCILPVIYTGMGLPPVVVGLFVYLLLSNQGPFGQLNWLFTPAAMVFAQTIIALPLMVGLTLTAVQSVDPMLTTQIKALGANHIQTIFTILTEARLGIIAAVAAAFGSIISEVGAVMLVGGNIQGETRVLTTAIVLETRKGNFSFAMALGFILLGITFLVNYLLYKLQQNEK